MMQITRRSFLRGMAITVLFAVCLLGALPTSVVAAESVVRLTQLDDRVRVEINGRLFTEYIFKGASRPYCYPVNAVDGTSLVRNYPMAEMANGVTY